jgi:hypothetical protein
LSSHLLIVRPIEHLFLSNIGYSSSSAWYFDQSESQSTWRGRNDRSPTTSNGNSSQKRILRTTVFKGSYLEKTSPLKPNAKAPKKTNLASKRKTAASKTKGNAQALPNFKKQTHHRFAFKDQFDDARVRRDEKEAREARENALEKLKTRDCNVERNTSLESTSDGSSEVFSVLEDSVVIDLLGLNPQRGRA